MGYISVFSFLNYSTEEMMLSRKAKGEGSVIFGNDGFLQMILIIVKTI